MPTLIDSSLWIDFTRVRSPRALKQFIAPYIMAADAALCEPIVFEVLRHANDQELRGIESQFQTLPLLATPVDVWASATKLGRTCRKAGINAGSIDLLIVAVAIHHSAELITFDSDFLAIASRCAVHVKFLRRP